ncbi:MAG TPA: AAC(3) family N-acetyltransferase [bacterium]|nr:AAC(3) family N-acetyltransferase [bacterium]
MTNSISKTEILEGLRQLGLRRGSVVLVHSSLSRFGRVVDGADTVIDALLESVGPRGTVMVPTLTGSPELSPSNPPVFDPVNTACWTGVIPETFRKRPGAIRSLHPTHSVAAIGFEADSLTCEHRFSITPCDDLSPYGKLARHPKGYVLLLGVGHECSTLFHHIEESAGVDYHIQTDFTAAQIVSGDHAIVRHYLLHQYGTPRNFAVMEQIFIERGIQRTATIGSASVRLIDAPQMVATTLRCLRSSRRFLCRP